MKRLGTVSMAALVVANMVGAGVFTTSGFALADLGRRELVLLAWAVGGAIALFGALSYGALARRLPESGGEYLFLARVFHPLAGFLAGWISLLAGFTAPIALAAMALEAYLFAGGGAGGWVGTLAIAAAVAMHGLRLRTGVVVQNLAVGLKLALVLALIAFGALRIDWGAAAPAAEEVPFELGAFAVTLVWISFSYSGWNAAVYVAGEARDTDRDLPRALVLGTLVVTAVYLALNAVFLYAARPADLAGKPEVALVAARALGGPGLGRAVGAVIALALFTSVSSMMMAGPRVYARMAADGLFPRLFEKGRDVPTAAVALQGALAAVVLWISEFSRLLGYVGFTLGLCSALAVSALFVLRRHEGAERVPAFGYPLVPLAYVATTLGAAAYMAVRQPVEAVLGVLTAAAGVPLYWLFRRRAGHAAAEASER